MEETLTIHVRIKGNALLKDCVGFTREERSRFIYSADFTTHVMVIETFEILNEKEQSLNGSIETLHPRKKQPVVILLNGILDVKESPVKKKIANALLKKYVVVCFDYTYGFGEGSGTAAAFTLSNQVVDIQHVIEHVTRRGYVDPEKVVLIGHCFGGMAAILHASFDERIKAVIAISTPYWFEDTRITRMEERDLSRIKLKRYFHIHEDQQEKEVRIDYSFFEDGMKRDMARAVRNLTQPTLIIHGDQDASIPDKNAQEIYDRLPGEKQLEIIENMGHNPNTKDVTKLIELINAFLKQHLK